MKGILFTQAHSDQAQSQAHPLTWMTLWLLYQYPIIATKHTI